MNLWVSNVAAVLCTPRLGRLRQQFLDATRAGTVLADGTVVFHPQPAWTDQRVFTPATAATRSRR